MNFSNLADKQILYISLGVTR